jgi:ribosomal RNA-processing protein 36
MDHHRQQRHLRHFQRMEQYDSNSGSDTDDNSSSSDSNSGDDQNNDVAAVVEASPDRQKKKNVRVCSRDEVSLTEDQNLNNPRVKDDASSSSSPSESDDDDDDDSIDYDMDDSKNEVNKDGDDDDRNNYDSNQSSSSSSDEEDEDDDEDIDVPLQTRIQRRNENDHGRNLQSERKRKLQALQVASQRLATFKKQQQGGNINKANKDMVHNISNKKKKSKHRPTEVSSKRADFFRRGIPNMNESGIGVEIGAKRYKPIDPRWSNLSGHFNEEQFQKNYEFLEQLRNQELGQARKRIAAYKATGDKGRRLRRKLGLDGSDISRLQQEDDSRLKDLTQERANWERRKIERLAHRNVKQAIRQKVESGQGGAYFLKRKEKKQLELQEKLKEIQKRKGNKAVEKILTKKRRKNKSRDAGLFA